MTHAKLARLAVSVLAISLVPWLNAAPAAAQASAEEECARLSNPADEIICLRAALAATRQAQGGNASSEPQARPASPPPAASPVRSATSPVAQAVPDRSRELGVEQVARAPQSPVYERPSDAVLSAISDFRVDRRGNLIMQLENGQIWGQVDTVDLPVRLEEGARSPVEIERSGFGGYRMTISDIDRKIAVSRLR